VGVGFDGERERAGWMDGWMGARKTWTGVEGEGVFIPHSRRFHKLIVGVKERTVVLSSESARLSPSELEE
jgi:hypothetical protein